MDPVEPREVGVTAAEDAPARQALLERFADRLVIRPELTRQQVSYQGNKAHPGLRWLRYKEAFSAEFVRSELGSADGPVLDPFAGIGTTALVASGDGRESMCFELMPVGVRVAHAISLAANSVTASTLEAAGAALLEAVRRPRVPTGFRFPHVSITERAFPDATEVELANARTFLHQTPQGPARMILDVACMSVLEEVSYTSKDGLSLRWDRRSRRPRHGRSDKGPIPGFGEALEQRLDEIVGDAPVLAAQYGGQPFRLIQDSALRALALLPDSSVGLTITSPPYANRYDYTRVYALELAWLGYDLEALRGLRQELISSTVEHLPKDTAFDDTYPRSETVQHARAAIRSQHALREVLRTLRERRAELSHHNIVRLIENYCLEMAIVIAELARITRPGGRVVMVNDNVQYAGEEVPMDLILSDIAEACGFECEEISVLRYPKGNASQQMGRYGRRPLRKCVYRWRMPEQHP